MPDTGTPIPLWLDCDTGHDDAFAILLAAHHPNIKLLGISTVYGNAPLQKTTYNTRAILKSIGREDVPVYPGSAKPFCRDAVHSPEVHGESGLDGTTVLPIPDVPERTEKFAIEAMYDSLIATPEGTAWLVPTGALTNAALLFATHPDLVDHIAGLSIMGGAIGGKFTDAPMGTVSGKGERFGNITPWAEFNIYIDPESAKSLLSNPALAAKTTLITLDLTHLFLATPKVQHNLLYGYNDHHANDCSWEPSPVRQLFLEILRFFAKTYKDVFGISAGPPVHDVLAVAAAVFPALFGDGGEHEQNGISSPNEAHTGNGVHVDPGIRYLVEVITEGGHLASSADSPKPATDMATSQCGRTMATPLPPFWHGVRIPNAVDSEKMWTILDGCLGRAEDAVGWVG